LADRKDIRSVQPHSANLQRFSSGTGRGGLEGNWLTKVQLEKRPLSGKSSRKMIALIPQGNDFSSK